MAVSPWSGPTEMATRSVLVGGGFATVTSTAAEMAITSHGHSRTNTGGVDQFAWRPPVDVTLTRLAAFVTSSVTGAGRYLKALRNGASTSLLAALADGALANGAVGEDTINGVACTAGDRVSLAAYKASGTAQIGNRAVIVVAGDKAVSPMVANTAAMVLDNSARYYALSGNLTVVTSLSDTRMTVRSPGTWRGLYAVVSANTGSGSVTIKGSRNAVDQVMAISIGPGETGQFWDNSNPVAVADGDALLYSKSGTTGASVTVTTIGSTIVNDDRRQDLFGYASRAWSYTYPNAGAYRGLPGHDSGTTVASTDRARYERSLGYPARISKLRVGAYNGIGVPVTTTLLVNGVASALTATTAAPAGDSLAEDTTHTVTVGPDDKLSFLHQSTGATSGNLWIESLAICIEDLTPPWRPEIATAV